MGRKTCSLKVLSDDGKMLHGTAVQLHYISEQGGWDKFVENLSAASAKVAVDYAFKELEKAKFKVIHGRKQRTS